MKLVYLSLRLFLAPLVAIAVAGMAWFMWLQEEYLKALDEYHE